MVVARIAGAYGILGWVRIVSFTEPPANLLGYRPWLLAQNHDWRELDVLDAKPHGAGFIARVREVASRDQAQALAGRLLAVPRDALPKLAEDAEYYWRDLIGLTVTDAEGRALGQVDHLLDTGAHDVLAIKQGERTTLIPFVARFVRNVDLASGTLVVDWQEPD